MAVYEVSTEHSRVYHILGRTPLHFVAHQTLKTPKALVVWDGKKCTVSEAWLAVASLLMEKGCDPRIKDHRGLLASNVARKKNNLRLEELLNKVIIYI